MWYFISNGSGDKIWSVYIVECADGSFYTGITTDVKRRVYEHNYSPKGAKYTRSRRPVTLITSAEIGSRSHALKVENKIKKLKRNKKVYFLNELKKD